MPSLRSTHYKIFIALLLVIIPAISFLVADSKPGLTSQVAQFLRGEKSEAQETGEENCHNGFPQLWAYVRAPQGASWTSGLTTIPIDVNGDGFQDLVYHDVLYLNDGPYFSKYYENTGYGLVRIPRCGTSEPPALEQEEGCYHLPDARTHGVVDTGAQNGQLLQYNRTTPIQMDVNQDGMVDLVTVTATRNNPGFVPPTYGHSKSLALNTGDGFVGATVCNTPN